MLLRAIVPATLAVIVLAGCAAQAPTYQPTTGAVVGDTAPRTVQYPNGRYQLYGQGTTSSPYYWAWIPTGSNPPSPPPIPPQR